LARKKQGEEDAEMDTDVKDQYSSTICFTLIPLDAHGSGSKKKMEYCLLICLIYIVQTKFEKKLGLIHRADKKFANLSGQKSSDLEILGSVI